MLVTQKIQAYLEKLPPSYQNEVVDFLAFLLEKAERQEDKTWHEMSLASAMRGMEDEPEEYSVDDLKVRYS